MNRPVVLLLGPHRAAVSGVSTHINLLRLHYGALAAGTAIAATARVSPRPAHATHPRFAAAALSPAGRRD